MGDDRLQHGAEGPQTLVELLLDLADDVADCGVFLVESVADLDQGGNEGFLEGVDGRGLFAERLELGVELVELLLDRLQGRLQRGVGDRRRRCAAGRRRRWNAGAAGQAIEFAGQGVEFLGQRAAEPDEAACDCRSIK